MWRIEDKHSGVGEIFDGPCDHAIKKMYRETGEHTVLCLWWVFGDHNVKVCEVSRLTPYPKLDWGKLAQLGWSNGEFKCPLCGAMFGKNLNGDEPTALVNQHVHKHFSF